MTLKGKQNHFNVKFLKGYGFSIRVKDSKIVLKNYSEIKENYFCNISKLHIIMFIRRIYSRNILGSGEIISK